MFTIIKLCAFCACIFDQINGFNFNGRVNFNSKSSLQMNDVRKTENKRDRSLAGILGMIISTMISTGTFSSFRHWWSPSCKSSHHPTESIEFIRRSLPPQVPLMEDPLIPMINVIVNAADARKATSISAFRISSITEITTFMVIVEG